MRWAGQQVTDDGAIPGMPALKGLVRSVNGLGEIDDITDRLIEAAR